MNNYFPYTIISKSKIIGFIVFLIIFQNVSCTSTKKLHNYKSFVENFSKPKWKRKHITPTKKINIESKIHEGSGLIAWNGNLWTHNDSGDPSLFSLDTLTGRIVNEYKLIGIKNNDWEDLSQDENYFYIGDFGNNSHTKNTLNIHKINKQELLKGNPKIESITFSWPEIINDKKNKKSNFDCEAMAIIGDSIYIFTKEWKKNHCTQVFSLPKKTGFYCANYRATLKTKVLVTGASYNETKKKLVLCGYNIIAKPRLLVFLEIDNSNLFGKRAIRFKTRKLAFTQMEGIGSFDGTTYFTINENFDFLFFHTLQGLHKFIIKDK